MATTANTVGFHDLPAAGLGSRVSLGRSDWQFTYRFQNFLHPFIGELIAKLNTDSLPGMFDPTWQDGLKQGFFNTFYNPTEDRLVQVNYFPKEIDVSEHGPYANYNWELFFH